MLLPPPWPTYGDYQNAVQNPISCFSHPELQQARSETNNLGLPRPISGSFAVVFPLLLDGKKDGKKWAVRCFTTYHPDQEKRYPEISQYLKKQHLPYTVDFEFIKQGIMVKGSWYPILRMEWVEGESLPKYIERNLNKPGEIQNLAEQFYRLVFDLKRCGIAHGDLQHGNIIVTNSGCRLVDYDGMFVPGLEGLKSNEIGHPNYQHPSRGRNDFGDYLDNFSAWCIYVSLLALAAEPGLKERVNALDDCICLRRKDFENPGSSQVMRVLEKIKDDRLQRLLKSFKEIINYLDISRIPPLDDPAISKKLAQKTVVSRNADWLKDERKEQGNLAPYEAAAIESFKNDNKFFDRLRQHGIPWKGVQEQLKSFLPNDLSDSDKIAHRRDKIAYQLVPKAMTALFGEQGGGWKTEKRPSKGGQGETTWVLVLTPPVVAVGDNDDGQCKVNGWRNIVQVAAGGVHTVGLKADGTVLAVGYNDDGQCKVNGWRNIVQFAAGCYHTVGLKADGTVVAVGYNEYGQLNVVSWEDIVQVAAGWLHTVGIKSDRTVLAVGYNDYEQCKVNGWRNIVQFAAGGVHTVGLKADGTVVAVGDNDYGQCKVDGWRNIVQVAAGCYHTVGLKADGTVVAVGYNEYGQLNVVSWEDIVQVAAGWAHTAGVKADGTVLAVGYNGDGRCEVDGWRNIVQVAAGGAHTVGLKSNVP